MRLFLGVVLMVALFLAGTQASGAGVQLSASLPADVLKDEPEVGAAHVFLGSEDGPSTTPDWKAVGPHKEAHFGFSVGTAGDVNGDGFDDVIVGARWFTQGQDREGAAYLYYGSGTGLSPSPSWSYASNQAGAALGSAVGTAGDVNGDGFSDVIVGAPLYDGGQTDEGAVLIFYGSDSGLSATPDRVIEGNQEGAQFGASVAGAGDVNGDGFDDIAAGAPQFDQAEEDVGAVFVYHGSDGGLSETASWTAAMGPTGSRFGHSVGTAGDVNGDGYADLVVGAPGWEDTPKEEPLEGGIFVFLGSSTGLAASPAWQAEGDKAEAGLGHAVGTAGDVNGDGLDDIVAGAPEYRKGEDIVGRAYLFCSEGGDGSLSFALTWTADGDTSGDQFGYSVGTAGDVDGNQDGNQDPEFVVGAPLDEYPVGNEGTASLFYGSPANWEVGSGQYGSRFGNSVGTAGDVNGDGYADIIVGAYRYRSPSPFSVFLPLVENGSS
jgi:hypothetical protein